MWFLLVLLIGLASLALLYRNLIRPLGYWKRKGIPYVTPSLYFGNTRNSTLKRQPFANFMQDLYNARSKESCVGFYDHSTPILMLRDLQLIKRIGIRDFDKFSDRPPFVPEDADPFWNRNLLALKGDEWKTMRATLSPAFTSSKMRLMFGLIDEASKKFVAHFARRQDEQKGIIEAEMKDVFTRFTNDVTASAIFGVSCDSLGNPENEFYRTVKVASNFGGGWKGLKMLGYTFCPSLMKLFKVSFFEDSVKNFFRSLVTATISHREKHNVSRPDMIQMMMEARKGRLKLSEEDVLAELEEMHTDKLKEMREAELNDEDITAQALIFFLGGFDTSSTLMCFVSYELAVNPAVQSRLVEEMRSVSKVSRNVDCDSLNGMKYLDMVVNETLRKWPPSTRGTRMVTEPYVLELGKKGIEVGLDVGTVCWIPIYAIHRDPRYYPDPDRFDPERFSERNRGRIEAGAFLPFGVGPKNCIGSRFALLKTKAMLFRLLSRFELVPVEKTEIPLTLSKTHANMSTSGGIWLGLKRRKAQD